MTTPVSGWPLSVVVVGASGDLAQRKIIPALFALYCQDLLPDDWRLFGYARTAMTHDAFRERCVQNLTCRYVPGESCQDRMDAFLARCFYCAGQYDSEDDLLALYAAMREQEPDEPVNHMFYLAVPPGIFTQVGRTLGNTGFVRCGQQEPWSRVVIEKPFGRDRASSDSLVESFANVFRESQTYRIDHYLGKEVIQNLLILRFANAVFEPIWNADHINDVQISWKEDLTVAGRGGYYDSYGVIRDVIQNHLLQILALVAMERPSRITAGHICNQKVKVLRSIPPISRDGIVTGQYAAAEFKGRMMPGYRDDETVDSNSRTPTYAAAMLSVENERWKGVPFLIQAGKGLGCRMTEIRIRFKVDAQPLFQLEDNGRPFGNELVIRVQPDESITLSMANKRPGMDMELARTQLDLQYNEAFQGAIIPDAYESLLLDVIEGERSLFIRRDELAAAWDIFTPVLHELDAEPDVPEAYPFGSEGPASASAFAARFGVSLPSCSDA